jgi:hypothetical protein
VDPVPARVTTGNGIARNCTSEGQGLRGLHQARS